MDSTIVKSWNPFRRLWRSEVMINVIDKCHFQGRDNLLVHKSFRFLKVTYYGKVGKKKIYLNYYAGNPLSMAADCSL